jgi:hypothetical protein
MIEIVIENLGLFLLGAATVAAPMAASPASTKSRSAS